MGGGTWLGPAGGGGQVGDPDPPVLAGLPPGQGGGVNRGGGASGQLPATEKETLD